MNDKLHPIRPAAAAPALLALPKEHEARLAREVPEHFFMEAGKLRVRYDQMQIRKDPEHKGQLLIDLFHGGQLLVTQMVPDGLDGGVVVLYGMTGSTGVSISND